MASDALAPDAVICVDLDGTLYRGELNVELALHLFARRPWLILMYPLWERRGRAVLKAEIAKRAGFDPARRSYNPELLAWLRDRKAEGHRLVLASGADRSVVSRVADYLGLFDEFMGSDGRTNLVGVNKEAALAARYPGFAYVGNSKVDIVVWRGASACYLVARTPTFAAQLSRQIDFARIFPRE
jgi:haloacid dehalogenase-like hydrolase